MDKSKLT